MTAQHSPGPWKAKYGHEIFSAEGFHIANVYGSEHTEGNAQLMAAAPELYAALHNLVALSHYCGKEHCNDEECVTALHAIKALAKARGEA